MVTYLFKHWPLPQRLYQFTWILVRHRHFFKKKREYSSCDCNENRFNSVILNTYHFYLNSPLESMSSGLSPLQILFYLHSVSRIVFPPWHLAPAILSETLHSPPSSLARFLLILPFQFRHNSYHQLSPRLPNSFQPPCIQAMGHRALGVTFLKCKS